MNPFNLAKEMLGLQEVRDRKRLMEFFKQNGFNFDPSKYPWCAVFVNCCERACGKSGTGKENARSFEKYGKEINEEDAQPGDIIVLKRGISNWQGHVGYFVEWRDDENTVVVLGGNQSDRVCYAKYIQDNILGMRRS